MIHRLSVFFAIALAIVPALSQSPAMAQSPVRLSHAELRELALAHSEDLLKSSNDSLGAALDRKTARASYLPSIDGAGIGAYVTPDMDMMGMTMQAKGLYLAGITAVQPLFAGGKIVAGNHLARIGEEVAREKRRATRAEVLSAADNAYWSLLSVRRKVDMLEAYSTQMDSLLSQVEVSVSADMATKGDLLRVRSKRSEIQYNLQKARNGEDLCRMVLCNAAGLPLETPVELIDTAIVVTAPGDLSSSLDTRPEYIMLQKGVEAGEEQVRMERGNMLPTVGLMGGYTYFGGAKMKGYSQDPSSGQYVPFTNEMKQGMFSAMVSVKVPIFHWGSERRKVQKAQLDLENARLDLQKNSRLMSIELSQAERNVSDGFNLVETAELGAEEAEENLRIMKERYGADMATLSDLLDAQSQWQSARSNLIEAQTQYLLARTAWLKASGRLD